MEKKYRIQLRTETYETYILHMKNLPESDEEEMMDRVINILDQELKKADVKRKERIQKEIISQKSQCVASNEQLAREQSFSEFGGFMSIEEENSSGEYIQVLGQKHEQ
tara:strand:+ start:674 stop:997 length:324 start_codon:yes stop_codon:yes gene_type:complete